MSTVLEVKDLVVEFPTEDGGVVHAVSGVSFEVMRGETLGLVGESGCGKSTTARAVVRLHRPTSGSVAFEGVDLAAVKPAALRALRPRLQMIFQDPVSSLNPRRRVREIVREGLEITGIPGDHDAAVDEVLSAVGLEPAAVGDRWPHEFSGGQCQRICLARALVLDPTVLICDEPVASLDVSVQAQILNLLADMRERYGLTMLFIAHDLAVVKRVCDRVAVMYMGKLCEVGPVAEVYAQPLHPYTEALLASVPVPDPDRPIPVSPVTGELPSPLDPPRGCRFHTRCPRATQRCREEEPVLRGASGGHEVACHFPNEPQPA